MLGLGNGGRLDDHAWRHSDYCRLATAYPLVLVAMDGCVAATVEPIAAPKAEMIGELKAAAIAATISLALYGALYLQYRIIHDCGWFGLLRGSEWLWLFGVCRG